MKVGIIGSRTFFHFTLAQMLEKIPDTCSEIVSGGAIGIDQMAEQAAERLGVPCKVFLPDYTLLGRQAPLSRNRQIVNYADLVIAFWDNRSRGTAHALNYCIETQKPFQIFNIQ